MSLANKLSLLANRVMVKRITPQTRTAAGVLLPESSVQMLNEATVLAVGPKLEHAVATGDRVIIPEFGGLRLKLDNEEVLIFRDEDILGVVRD